jgi:glycosyltransferase involved in cell wall biosynthesis
MILSPRVSIVITNHNYGHFLAQSIDSALAQSYPHVQVIVVDDGSIDDSQAVIEAFGDRIVSVLKENGGQGSAFNAGFAVSDGDLICFLDADDIFLPHKVEKVVEAWLERQSDVIYHQLVAVNDECKLLFNGKPWPRRMVSGDISARVQRSGGWWPCVTTSGLCVSRCLLERIFPMPEEHFRTCADAYIVGIAPFLGTVHGLKTPLSLYRLHSNNVWSYTGHMPDEYRKRAERYRLEMDIVRADLRARYGISATMSMNDHYLHQYYLRRAGTSISLVTVLNLVFSCSVLPYASRMREALRILIGRA